MKMNIAIALLLVLLTACAHAEYYTAKEDIYYHEKTDCTAGSSYVISEEAAWHFRKVACPVCVNRTVVEGEIITLPLPELFNLYSADMDADGNMLLAGYAGTPSVRNAYIGIFSTDGKCILEQLSDEDNLFYRDANVLSNGSIAALRLQDGSAYTGWQIQVASGGEITHRLPVLHDISCLEPTGDGILAVNRASTEECALLKYDNSGNELWRTSLDGFYKLMLLPGEGVHLAYGTRAVDAKDYQGDQNAHAVIFDDNGTVLCRITDTYAGNSYGFECAAWCADGGAVLCGRKDRPGFIVKYNQKGEEIWRRSLEYLCGYDLEILINGSPVRCLEIMDILPLQDGLLLAISTNSGFVRMILIDSEGYVKLDWIEKIGDDILADQIKMFEKDGDIFLLADYLTMVEMDAFEAGMTIADIPRKYISKQLAMNPE